jgi:hypothetical protein
MLSCVPQQHPSTKSFLLYVCCRVRIMFTNVTLIVLTVNIQQQCYYMLSSVGLHSQHSIIIDNILRECYVITPTSSNRASFFFLFKMRRHEVAVISSSYFIVVTRLSPAEVEEHLSYHSIHDRWQLLADLEMLICLDLVNSNCGVDAGLVIF